MADCVQGDIAAWHNSQGIAAHVALLFDMRQTKASGIDWEVLSQFGSDGEYIHPITDLPRFYEALDLQISYWTERKQ